MWAPTLVAEVIGFIVLGAVGLMLLAMAGAYVNDLIRTRPARCGSKLRACHQPPAEDRAACVRSIRFFPTDELGNLLDHLFFNAGITVLGKGAARIGGHRMTFRDEFV